MAEKLAPSPSSRPKLTDRNARNYYGQRPDFQRVVERIGSPDNRKKFLEQNDLLLKRIKWALGLLILLAILNGLSVLWVVIAFLIGNIVIPLIIGAINTLRKSQLNKYTDSLQRAEDCDIELINRIEAEWESYCVNFSDYPPDWKYRRFLVLERDQRICCKCCWPTGVQLMDRELHVHHKKPLSRGGDNALSNLETLCASCHKKQEGSGHRLINSCKQKMRN